MTKAEAEERVKAVVEVRDLIASASTTERYPHNNLVVLRNMLHAELEPDHGERDHLFVPHWDALKGIERLDQAYSKEQFKTAFKTVKGKLLSIANRYIREMHKGIDELFHEPARS